jgi:hypothetical protein
MRRLIDPQETVDRHVSETLGVRNQRNITGELDDAGRARKSRPVTVNREGVPNGDVDTVDFVGAGVSVEVIGNVATVTIDPDAVDTTTQTKLVIDADLGPLPKYSGQFRIEDAAITDDAVILVYHVGKSEKDDEPEFDGIVCIPNQPSRGAVIVNWQAVPGPVSGSRSFRYMLAGAS